MPFKMSSEKAAGIIAVVVIAQIIIKVVIDTINFFPILPGLLELLGVIVVVNGVGKIFVQVRIVKPF